MQEYSSSSSVSLYPLVVPGKLYRLNSSVLFFRLYVDNVAIGENDDDDDDNNDQTAVKKKGEEKEERRRVAELCMTPAYSHLKNGTSFSKGALVLCLRPSPIIRGVTAVGCWDVLYEGNIVVPINEMYLTPIDEESKEMV